MSEFGGPQDGSKTEPVAETAQWTYGDKVSGLVDGLFEALNRDPSAIRNLRGFASTTLSKKVEDTHEQCKMDVGVKARRVEEWLEPTEVDIGLDSSLYEDALLFFGAIDGVTSDVRIRLSTDGSLNITGRLLDDKRKEIRRIGFYSSEIGTNPRKKLNTMSPQEAMDLTRKVADRFTEYSTARR